MAKLTIKLSDGTTHETTLDVGQRVLTAAYALGLDERGFGECGGNCVCSTCHVFLEKGAEVFPATTDAEEDLLDTTFNYQPNSRLACQLVLKEDAEEVIVKVASF